MADAQSSATAGHCFAQQSLFRTRECRRCGEEKDESDFRVSRGRVQFICLRCRAISNRKWYRSSPDASAKQTAATRARMIRLRQTEEGREKIRQAKRRVRERLAARGLTCKGTPRILPPRDVIRASAAAKRIPSEARNHIRRWLRSDGPVPCVAAWYATTGKPWNNPRLSSGDKFTVRYHGDEVFRARQVLKAQNRKVQRARRIAETCDGTVTDQTLAALFAETKSCTYCGVPMRSQDKTHDHIVALFSGGRHTLSNIVICCKPCNTEKGRRSLEAWLTAKPPKSSYHASISSRLRCYWASHPERCVTGPMLRAMATELMTARPSSSGSWPALQAMPSSTTNANA